MPTTGPVAAGQRQLRGRAQQRPGLRRVARRELHLRAQHGEVGLALRDAEGQRVGGDGGVDDGEVGAGRVEIARHALDLRLRGGEAAVSAPRLGRAREQCAGGAVVAAAGVDHRATGDELVQVFVVAQLGGEGDRLVERGRRRVVLAREVLQLAE